MTPTALRTRLSTKARDPHHDRWAVIIINTHHGAMYRACAPKLNARNDRVFDTLPAAITYANTRQEVP